MSEITIDTLEFLLSDEEKKEIITALKLQELVKERIKEMKEVDYPCGEGIIDIGGKIDSELESLVEESEK
jgi:hypothetical protein